MNVPAILIDIADALMFNIPSIVLRDELVRKYDITIADAMSIIRAAEREINALDKASADKQEVINALGNALYDYSPLGTAYSKIKEKLDITKAEVSNDEKKRADASERISRANKALSDAYSKKELSTGQLLSGKGEIREY